MEMIKRILCLERKKTLADRKHTISPPLESLSENRKLKMAYPCSVLDPTLDFTPRDQAHNTSIAYLQSGTSEDLNRLLDDRDRGEIQVHQGPKTSGTEEVQRVLSEPSIKSIERLHNACKQAELSLRYGNSSKIIYNFSKSLAWNVGRGTPRIPSLQLTDFGSMFKGAETFSGNPRLSWALTHDSESNFSETDTDEESGYDSDDSSLETLDDGVLEVDWEMQEAKALTVTQIPLSKVHKVQVIYPRSNRPIYEMD